MTSDVEETIAAIASPPGGGARGIVRLSGPRSVACIERVFEPNGDVDLATERIAVCLSGTAKAATDDQRTAYEFPADLYLWPTDRSYTRQPVAELHTLGSPPLLDALLRAVCRAGARLAAPGEFTLRAFLAGRLDLAQAEAVLGVIDAQGPRQLQTALAQLAGGLSGPLHAIREELINVLAEVEAGLDFVDEDAEFISAGELDRRLAACQETVQATLHQMTAREDRPALFRVVLSGPTNAGKSSLFNALVGRYGHTETAHAIVSAIPGTTRDYLVARLDLGGCLCELVDTAGTMDPGEERTQIERASDEAARRQRGDADLVLECIDAASPVAAQLCRPAEKSLAIITKADLAGPHTLDQLASRVRAAAVTSAQNEKGIDALVEQITEAMIKTSDASGVAIAATAARCRDSLAAASQSLAQARDLASKGCGDELVAVEIRQALADVGMVVGAVYTDDILDRIFSRFCIGK